MRILYHANCTDGFCAAWVMHNKYPDATFTAVNYGEDPPNVLGEDVIIVDFCYPAETMEKLSQLCNSLYVLDHHATAKDVAGKYGLFDNSKSGAVLAWEYAFPTEAYQYVPPFVLYVQDRDLWTWAMQDSREFSAGLATFPHNFDVWDKLYDEGVDPIIVAGKSILRYQKQVVESHVRNAKIQDVLGYLVPVVNATTLISEIGNELSLHCPFSASYFDRMDGMRIWSLRSQKDGLDVGVLAKTVGGGGHKNAAGFQTKIEAQT